ncbi:SusE domain-containing protein [Rudanella lutea]|uniref:SusE domain-containing protein n=1 Tax=Rudanella lutea TaxID=451374 RepID=UPI000380F90A|nr:SusE domain-containing protein [Rudanella lutea]
MQRITLYSVFSLLALCLLWGCENEGDRLVMQEPGAVTLTPSASTVTLTSSGSASNALTLNWTPVNYGVAVPVNYAVQFDKKGNGFKAPIEVTAGQSTTLALSNPDLNQTLLRLGVSPGTSGQIEMRVRSAINRPNDQPGQLTYSAPVTLTGTPYLVIVNYPSLFVPGGYQGWAPDVAPKISSVKSDGSYEGYIYFPAASEFKITSAPNWNSTNYGIGAAPDKISSTGDNLKLAAGGYYLFRVNTGTLTWSATPTTWGVIGAATPKGWDASTPMTYDAKSGTWKAELSLKQDELKFRANDAWTLNFGDNGADGFLEYDGQNIKVPSAGTYTIELDLRMPGYYAYKLTKK